MKVVARVENILQNIPETRSSDKLLLLKYWEQQGLCLNMYQRSVFLGKCTTAETITRARRALKETYPATETVDNERFDKYMQFKNEKAVSWIDE